MKARNPSLAICGLALCAATLVAAPRIERIDPMSVAPGARTVLTFSGSDLDTVSNLWTSFNAEVERVRNTNDGQVSFSIRCPKEASGIQAVQLIGPEGASAFRLVMIDYLKVQPNDGKNRLREDAARITPPIAIDGVLKSEQVDFYKFESKAGHSYSIEVLAHRIGSQMDPTVRVLDPAGKELAFCDDEGGVWKDARFRFTAPVNGDYTIAVHDVAYGGGSNFEYRLRVSNDPLVWFTYPLVDPREPASRFESIGEAIETRVSKSPANPPAALLISAGPQIGELEPNDQRHQSQPLTTPVLLNGRMQTGSDVDYFKFTARKDEHLIFKSQTRSLGSPCDLVLRILKEDGSPITQSDMGSAVDATVTNKFAEAGGYLLEVRELSGTGITNAPYRVMIEEFAPGFTLATENNIIAIKPGESAKAKITAARFGYDGPIEIKIEPQIEGITLENNSIKEKKNDVELTLKASEQLAPGFSQHVTFSGQGTNGIPAKVNTTTALRKAFPLMLNSPLVLDGLVNITIRGK